MKSFIHQMPQEPVEKTRKLIIERNKIGFFKAILESYEDVAIFTVLDGKSGLIELIYSTCFEEEISAIVQDMIHCGIAIKEATDGE